MRDRIFAYTSLQDQAIQRDFCSNAGIYACMTLAAVRWLVADGPTLPVVGVVTEIQHHPFTQKPQFCGVWDACLTPQNFLSVFLPLQGYLIHCF